MKRLILSGIKVSGGSIEGTKDEPHSDRSFGIKWHNIPIPAMNDWLMKGPVQFLEM